MSNLALITLGQLTILIPILIHDAWKFMQDKRERERSRMLRTLLTLEENNDHAENYPEGSHE